MVHNVWSHKFFITFNERTIERSKRTIIFMSFFFTRKKNGKKYLRYKRSIIVWNIYKRSKIILTYKVPLLYNQIVCWYMELADIIWLFQQINFEHLCRLLDKLDNLCKEIHRLIISYNLKFFGFNKSQNISLWAKKIVKMNGHKKMSKRQKLKIRQIIAREKNWQIESWSWNFFNHGGKENCCEIRTCAGKVHIFWEGHKILQKSSPYFWLNVL